MVCGGGDCFSFKTLLKIWKHWKHFLSPEGSWV
jgi:hypothetical protein